MILLGNVIRITRHSDPGPVLWFSVTWQAETQDGDLHESYFLISKYGTKVRVERSGDAVDRPYHDGSKYN